MSKILVVEDDEDTANAIKDYLVEEGFQVEVALDGLNGFERAVREPFDLVILDVILPKKDGYSLCRDLRNSGNTTPVIMLTERRLEWDEIEGLKQGADDYVTKPFSFSVLLARIRKRLRNQAAETYTFGDLTVNVARAECLKATVPVPLTPLEMKLLIAFLRNTGIVLSRDRLLDLVWGSGSSSAEHAVDTHITNLRRKIEPDPKNPAYIRNVPGFGYIFEKKTHI